MARWTIAGQWRNTPVAATFASLEAVFALAAERVTGSTICEVSRVVCAGQVFYLKRYSAPGVRLPWLRSKARCEWENLRRFARWGMQPAPLVAWGEERGAHRRGVVITAAVPCAQDLHTLARAQSPLLRDRHWVAAVSVQVAAATRAMHRHRFAHNDWKWRNILVNGSAGAPRVHVIDCPSGGFWWGPFFEYRRIKDLACLDKMAKYHLSPRQRLAFYRAYTGRARLTPHDKKIIARIAAFFDGRE